MSSVEYRHIVRIAGKDIDGSKKLVVALSEIKGIGFNFAQILLNTLQVDPNLRVGFLSEKEVGIIENGIKNPEKIGMPKWFLNRQKDVETGSAAHIITSDWDLTVHNDIEREKGVMSWRGFRHMMGLKVRGQRTRTTGRKGGAVGVKKTGKLLPTAVPAEGEAAAAAAAAPAGKEAPAGKVGTAPPAKGSPAVGGKVAGAAPTAKPAGAPAADKGKATPKKEEPKPAEKGAKK